MKKEKQIVQNPLVEPAKALQFDGQVPDVDHLNEVFTPLQYRERIHLLYAYFKEREVLVTSSFGANAAFLLFLLHQLRPTQRVHFIDTTYHFRETLEYKRELTERFNLTVVDVLPDLQQNALTAEEQWWSAHPRLCCTINKVAPLEPVKARHRVWLSGLMAYQTPFRAGLRVFEKQGEMLKFHPLIDLEEAEFLYQFSANELPRHPLERLGYGSIGCTHCTEQGEGREGRWKGSGKTECGLHPGYFDRKTT
ncbi:MAG: phosphoadenylyl-sulfate reductase [Saprospiraceae bacterium]|nr:phosphoadenylyl-sulfate reductase [Saprospiraceae bacterium]MCB0627100.1 phosphoadenylyl-sulfate reductase [Saprospiraceae bacterium]MCB0675851.1 phosphoadenylyl-sulfate reductase [Saprospiraceae bacterium]MCB0682285.1 phosphoadenylyl-sulfate reductase [Saprospiraceae bacterium]